MTDTEKRKEALLATLPPSFILTETLVAPQVLAERLSFLMLKGTEEAESMAMELARAEYRFIHLAGINTTEETEKEFIVRYQKFWDETKQKHKDRQEQPLDLGACVVIGGIQ